MKAEFSEEELELLAYGFGFYVQEFPLDDNDSARALLAKLYQLIGTEEDKAGPPPRPAPTLRVDAIPSGYFYCKVCQRVVRMRHSCPGKRIKG